MKHRVNRWLIPISSVAVSCTLLAITLSRFEGKLWGWVWRPYAFVILTGILVITATIALILWRTRSEKGALYWFIGVLSSTLVWQFLALFQTLSSSLEAAIFWQSMMPLSWLSMVLMLLIFTVSYVDDTDIPRKIGMLLVPYFSVITLIYIAGSTNSLESHVPLNSYYSSIWGYGNAAGEFEIIVFAWFFLIASIILFMFIQAYRRAISPTNKKQLKLFIIGLSQFIFLAVSVDVVYYMINPNYPPMSVLYSSALCLIIGYGIIKHGIFKISPSSLAEPILDNLSEAVIAVNSDMLIEFTNTGAASMFGRAKQQLVGMHIKDVVGNAVTWRITEHFTMNDSSLTIDETAIQITDKQMPVSMSVSRIEGHSAGTYGYIFVIQDIAGLKKETINLAHQKAEVERKVAERAQELVEERARLHASIESLTLGFLLIDHDGTIAIQNGRLTAMLGLDKRITNTEQLNHKVKGFNFTQFCRDIRHNTGIQGSKEVTFGPKVLRIFGTPVEVDDTNGGRSVIGTALLVEDITEVKVLERSRDEFFSIASHELRTPLSTIRGNSSMIKQYYPEIMKDEAIHQIIDDIHESSVRLIDIVNDFLDTSRLEQDKIAFSYESCSLEDIINDIIHEMKPLISEKKIHLWADVSELNSLPKIWADKSRVQQIIYNLVGNAIKFTENGDVKISGKRVNDSVVIEVTDTGTGIPKSNQKYLFHKFQQAGTSILTRDSTRGTGLGLYISRLLAEKMGGAVELGASASGKGSTFVLRLPIDRNKPKTRLPE